MGGGLFPEFPGAPGSWGTWGIRISHVGVLRNGSRPSQWPDHGIHSRCPADFGDFFWVGVLVGGCTTRGIMCGFVGENVGKR